MVSPAAVFVSLNAQLASFASVVCVVTLVLITIAALAALSRSIFSVPAAPGSASEPSALIAFHSVDAAAILHVDFMELP